MKTKDENIEEQFAEEAVKALPEARQMLVESAGLHTVLALSLADIYSSEATRLKAKLGAADPRVADLKSKKAIAADKAKEIVGSLVTRKSPATQNTAQQQVNTDNVPTQTKPSAPVVTPTSKPAVAQTSKPTPDVKPVTKTAASSKADPKVKAKPKTKSKPRPGRAKPETKKTPTRKGRSRSK